MAALSKIGDVQPAAAIFGGTPARGKAHAPNYKSESSMRTRASPPIDRVDIKGLGPLWLHRRVALRCQEPTLFDGTALDNVLCRGRWLPDGAAWTPLEKANAKKFAEKMANQLDQLVGNRKRTL
jgi:ABC-type transport system involved in cytochrome bd biosynthesis fused ATPase/permease subunit